MKLHFVIGSLATWFLTGETSATLSSGKPKRRLRSDGVNYGSFDTGESIPAVSMSMTLTELQPQRRSGKATYRPTPSPATAEPTVFPTTSNPTDFPTLGPLTCPFDEPRGMEMEKSPLITSVNKKLMKKRNKDKNGFDLRRGRNAAFIPKVIESQDGGVTTPEIVGGNDVEPPRKFAFFVGVNNLECGGSLIAPDVVLSAAQCFIDPLGDSPETVSLGLHKILLDDDDVEEFSNVEHIPIKRSAIHPNFRFSSFGFPQFDFWVIELEWSTTKYMDYVLKLDSPDDDFDLDDGRRHILNTMGYGSLFEPFGPAIFPNVLQEVGLDYTANDCCGDYPQGSITDDMLCAAGEGRDACLDDVGGPVIDEETGLQVGITSFGQGCADPNFASVYARLAEGYDFVQDTLEMWGSDPAPGPAPEVCDDDVAGWFDSDGPFFNCLWYAENDEVCIDSEDFVNGGLSANLACCACAPIEFPEDINVMNDERASLEVLPGYTGSYAAEATNLQAATITRDSVDEAQGGFNPNDGFSTLHEFEVSPGAAVLRIALPPSSVANEDIDLDLFLINPQGITVASSEEVSTDEVVQAVDPVDGTWSLYVYGFDTNGSIANYDLFSWVIEFTEEKSGDDGIQVLVSAPDSVVAGEAATVFLNFEDLPEGLFLGALRHFGKGDFRGISLISVDNLPSGMAYPAEVSGNGETGDASFEIRFDYTGCYKGLPFGLVPALASSATITSNSFTRDSFNVFEFNLVDSALFRFATSTIPPLSDDIDVDLYILDPNNQLVATSLQSGSEEAVQVINPTNGLWKVYVFPFDLDGLRSVEYDYFTWDIGFTQGPTLEVTSKPPAAINGTVGTVGISWMNATQGEWHLGFVAHAADDDIDEVDRFTVVSVDNRIPLL